jgi:ABC-2 type transport system permease protein
MLPKVVQYISALIPITYFLEYFRTGYGFKPVFPHPLSIGFGITVFYIILLFYLLNIAHKRARKNGMIIKLSE